MSAIKLKDLREEVAGELKFVFEMVFNIMFL